MKYSYNWLKELSGTNKTAEEVAELFLTHSFEVEGIEDLAKGLDKVVIGEVLEVEKHPDADRLNIAQVDVGEKNGGKLQIVCGAPNLAVGQKVPVALVGAKIRPIIKTPTDKSKIFKIEKSKIRGVESNGMICAEDELGLGDDHEGIMVLSHPRTDADLKRGLTRTTTRTDAEKNNAGPEVGQDFAEYMGLKDKVLDIDILPNRGHDCLSYSGVAQELSALENFKFKILNFNSILNDKILNDNENENEKLKVEIQTPNCSRYAGVRIKNIKIGPSPQWMQARLKASGMKPINNIVDITNYVMLETNQPLHAFNALRSQTDADTASPAQKSAEKTRIGAENSGAIDKVVVRQAEDSEKIELLDGQELELMKDDIVITDGEKPIALAGVMGGLDSGVQDDTTEIILEGANFKSTNIRFTARRYNLQTDAAYRFERDIDPNFVDDGLTRAVELIKELAGGEVVSVTDIYPEPVKPWTVELDTNYVRRLLGVEIEDEKIKSILNRLGVEVESQRSDVKSQLFCTVPTRRRDLRTQEDLIEEVGRIYGYEKIKPKPVQAPVQTPHRNEQRFFERKLKDISVQSGFSEIRSYSFHSEKDAEALGLKNIKHIELLNPASPEQQMMRNTLAVGILKAGRKSLSHFKEVRIFEVGKVYKVIKGEVLPKEILSFAGGVFSKGKSGEQFCEVKGLIDTVLESFGVSGFYYDDKITEQERPLAMPELHPSRQALLRNVKGEVIGWLGEVNKKTAKHFGLKNVRGAIFEIDVDKLQAEARGVNSFQPLAKFPFVERDLSMLVGDKLRVAEVENLIYKAGGKLLQDVDLFDLYQNKETGERSMAFHLLFGDSERTLEAKEVDKAVKKIIEIVESELDIEVKK